MRKLINIVEGKVVPFGQKSEDGFSDDEKYRGAGATQASGLTKNLNPDNPFHSAIADHIQDVFTTMAAGKPISDEQRETSRIFLKIGTMASKMTVHSAAFEIIQTYNRGRPDSEKVSLSYKDAGMAYLKDDEGHLKDRLVKWTGEPLFATNNVVDLYEYVFEHYLPLIPHSDNVEKWLQALEKVVENKESYDGEIEPFDPHTEKFSGLTMYVVKLIKRWGTSKDRYRGTIFTDQFQPPYKMAFWPADQKSEDDEKLIEFASLEELEDYIRIHRAELEAWWEAEQAKL